MQTFKNIQWCHIANTWLYMYTCFNNIFGPFLTFNDIQSKLYWPWPYGMYRPICQNGLWYTLVITGILNIFPKLCAYVEKTGLWQLPIVSRVFNHYHCKRWLTIAGFLRGGNTCHWSGWLGYDRRSYWGICQPFGCKKCVVWSWLNPQDKQSLVERIQAHQIFKQKVPQSLIMFRVTLFFKHSSSKV